MKLTRSGYFFLSLCVTSLLIYGISIHRHVGSPEAPLLVIAHPPIDTPSAGHRAAARQESGRAVARHLPGWHEWLYDKPAHRWCRLCHLNETQVAPGEGNPARQPGWHTDMEFVPGPGYVPIRMAR